MRVPDLDGAGDSQERVTPKIDFLNHLADQLRSVWIEEVQRYHLRETGRLYKYKPGPTFDGGCDAMGHKHKPIWPQLAKFVFDHGLNPSGFIKAQFENCKGRAPKSPNMLMGSKAVRRYREYEMNREVERDLEIARDAQIRYAKDALENAKLLYGSGKTAYRVIILSDDAPLSALFRYILAHSCEDEEMMRLWYKAAVSQYLYEADAYDEVWGSLIPQSLRDEVKLLKIDFGQKGGKS